MKHISEVTNSTTNQPSATPSTEYSQESKQIIQEILLLMKANYGHKWTSNITTPEDMKLTARLWLHHFHSHNRETLHLALSRCFLEYDWPPTVKEFQSQLKLIQSETRPDCKLLTRQVGSGLTETGREAIRKCRESLLHKPADES